MPNVALLLFSLVCICIALVVLKQQAWGPLIQAFDARERRIKQAQADADEARHKAELLLADHAAKMASVDQDVKHVVAAARQEAEKAKAEMVAQAEKEAKEILARALADVAAAKQQALSELDSQVEHSVSSASQRLVSSVR